MLFSEKNKKKNLILYLCLILFISGGIFFLMPSVTGAAETDLPKATLSEQDTGIFDYLAIVIKAPIYAVFVLCGWLASVALILFEWAIKPINISGDTGLLNQPNIYEMWQFIRDFFNLFFILVLLYIAFTVVFQIQKNFKQALLSLVLAALFVNFSYPISRALIDMTNVPMYFFANQIAGSDAGPGIFGQTLTASEIGKILLPGSEDGGDIEWAKTSVARFLVATIFMFLFAITLVVLALMFIVRLVALMILVVFSSVGFAASIIPGLEKYSKMWWDNFWKYALFGPVAMLMLLVATRFFSAMNDANAGVFGKLTLIATDSSTDPTFIASMAMFSFPIIMLWMAIGLAQTMSIAGAASVVGKGEAFAKWAGKSVTKTPALWAGRKYEKIMTTQSGKKGEFMKWLAPTAVYKGFEKWREYGHEKDRSPIEHAGAEIADSFSRMPFSKDHTDLAFKNYSANISKEQKEISAISTNSDYVIHELINAIKSGDDEKTIGALQILASQNDFNDLMHAMDRIQKETGKNFGKDGKPASTDMSSENAKEAIKNMMIQTGTSPELTAKAMMNLSNNATAAGNVGMAGAAGFKIDKTTGKGSFEIADEDDQAFVAAVKLQNLETQARQRTLHHNAIFKEESADKMETIVVGKDEKGEDIKMQVSMGDINGKVGQAVLGTITKADTGESKRSRDDLKREVSNRMLVLKHGTSEQKAKLAGMQKIMNENENVKSYFESIFEHYTGNTYSDDATSSGKRPKTEIPTNGPLELEPKK